MFVVRCRQLGHGFLRAFTCRRLLFLRWSYTLARDEQATRGTPRASAHLKVVDLAEILWMRYSKALFASHASRYSRFLVELIAHDLLLISIFEVVSVHSSASS